MKDPIDHKNLFEFYFKTNVFNDPESRSGTGSNLEQTKILREAFPAIIRKYHIISLLDVPCGDFFWMKEIQYKLAEILEVYIGGDIVNDIIEINNQAYSKSKFSFCYMDILKSQLPKVDLIFCRDCFVHFSYEDILRGLVNIKKSKSTFLLTTTFPGRKNKDIITGGWRPLDLQKFPFYLCEPIELFFEGCSQDNGRYMDKSIAIWKVKEVGLTKLKFLLFLLKVFRYSRLMARKARLLFH